MREYLLFTFRWFLIATLITVGAFGYLSFLIGIMAVPVQ
jgi:hypothetical protein